MTPPSDPGHSPGHVSGSPSDRAVGREPDDPEVERAEEAALGGEMLGALDPLLLMESLSETVSPESLMKSFESLAARMPAVLAGQEAGPLPSEDARFQDPAFMDNSFYQFVATAYLMWEREMMSLVEDAQVDWRTRERSRFLMGAFTSGMAPTNTLLGNPAALKQAFDTGGRSLMLGMGNLARDLWDNNGLPSQVDKSAFTLGVDIAATPGWVVHRTEMFELMQYTPTTESVGAVPLLLLPPPVNKYYFWDLAPGRSLIEYAVSRGVEVYTIVWRDPWPDNGDWGVDRYLRATVDAVDVVLDISRRDCAHLFGDCSGGMFLTMLLAYEAATGRSSIRSGTLGVTVVDFGEPGGIGMTASDRSLESIRKRAENKEVISAASIASTFVWMRPDDLVWRYLIDEWLMGNKPPAFDIMYWNADGMGMPAQLAYDLTELSLGNLLMTPGALTVLDTPVDLSTVRVDTYQIAGRNDHISPWRGCFAASHALGGDNVFVLTPTGHVQSIIYPPTKKRAAFDTNRTRTTDPDEWLSGATRTEESWWGHWVDWLLQRSDGTRPAPSEPGNNTYPPIVPAPGQYVKGE